MTRKQWGVVLALILLAVGIEIAVRSYSPAKGAVQIVNRNDEPMEESLAF